MSVSLGDGRGGVARVICSVVADLDVVSPVRRGALQGLSRLPVQEARCHYGGSPSPDEALSSGSSSNAFDD